MSSNYNGKISTGYKNAKILKYFLYKTSLKNKYIFLADLNSFLYKVMDINVSEANSECI